MVNLLCSESWTRITYTIHMQSCRSYSVLHDSSLLVWNIIIKSIELEANSTWNILKGFKKNGVTKLINHCEMPSSDMNSFSGSSISRSRVPPKGTPQLTRVSWSFSWCSLKRSVCWLIGTFSPTCILDLISAIDMFASYSRMTVLFNELTLTKRSLWVCSSYLRT